MTDEAPRRTERLRRRLGSLSAPALAAIGVAIVVGFSGVGYYAFQTYDYIEHDNDFCLSCHLMVEPYELFAESAHQGLGCKACHQPNLMQRSQMALTQFASSPDSLSAHAEVPNEVCADCHIDGDPEKWRLIANSAGHRAHFESDAPELQGLNCVECHSTSLHQFAPIDQTCAQSGCHQDQTIQLGGMSDLAIHCAACHTFSAPVGDESLLGSPVEAALMPDYDECLSCHVMRTLAQMPDPDPHQGSCGSCHNPHEQETPAEAAESCATAGCHQDAVDLSSFHVGIEPDDLSNCLYCHQAHDFSLNGGDCAACHAGADAPPDPETEAFDFQHAVHTDLNCSACHESSDAHGTPTVTTVADCRSCHHAEPEAGSCASCHAAADAPTATFERSQAMSFSVGTSDDARALTFPHADHADLDCASCHTEGIDLSVSPDLDCRSCHEDHHTEVSDCAACHVAAPVSAHPPEQAHVTCSGAGCHTDVPFESVPRTREFCLGCHQDRTDHEPGRVCADCHVLPEPTGGAGVWW